MFVGWLTSPDVRTKCISLRVGRNFSTEPSHRTWSEQLRVCGSLGLGKQWGWREGRQGKTRMARGNQEAVESAECSTVLRAGTKKVCQSPHSEFACGCQSRGPRTMSHWSSLLPQCSLVNVRRHDILPTMHWAFFSLGCALDVDSKLCTSETVHSRAKKMNIWTNCPASSLGRPGFLFLETILVSKCKGSKQQRLSCEPNTDIPKGSQESPCQLNCPLGTGWAWARCPQAFSHHSSTDLTSHVGNLRKQVLTSVEVDHDNTTHAINFCVCLCTRWPTQIVPKWAFSEVQNNHFFGQKLGCLWTAGLINKGWIFISAHPSVELPPDNKIFTFSITASHRLESKTGHMTLPPLGSVSSSDCWSVGWWLSYMISGETMSSKDICGAQLWWENSWKHTKATFIHFPISFSFPVQIKKRSGPFNFLEAKSHLWQPTSSLHPQFSDTLEALADSTGNQLIPQRTGDLFPEASIQNKGSYM